MIKKLGKYLLVFLLLLTVGCNTERPVDWTPTFDSAHTIPYGTYVLHRKLKDLFPDSKIIDIKQNTYEYLEEIQYNYESDSYMAIYPSSDLFTDAVWEKLLAYVNSGRVAFVSLGNSNYTFEKYLEVKYHSFEPPNFGGNINVSLSVLNAGKENSYNFQKGVGTNYFSGFNPEITEVLGYVNYKGKKEPNFIKVHHGNGYFLLHTEPFAFTNYYMLRGDNYKYAADVLSYIPDENILWDNHRINQREKSGNSDGGFFSALSFILKHQSLRWAFFILLSMGILFLIFNSKRRQKAIKIIQPYPNYSLSFAQTLSELYKNNADHTAIVKYKINYFLEQIRTHYNISAKDTEKDFSELLSAKSGVDLKLCKKLALQIDIFRSKNYLDKEDFFKLQSLIHSFNQKSGHYGRTTGRK
ncbi:hypothetical protein [Moheibacter sediminis]|uniref:DUF4350 domain-containing protein n=1 Tax=Moheibacter sediminis TaxID=1434700 RepID=A0A1W1ZYZ7_9FLAO|nr:hypothetical protein [Moheibacter sediminis]SMC53381.1 hypothetical protein SAMN06296427_103332 [Moheibacter sediminis]